MKTRYGPVGLPAPQSSALPAEAQEHGFQADSVAMVRENFVARGCLGGVNVMSHGQPRVSCSPASAIRRAQETDVLGR